MKIKPILLFIGLTLLVTSHLLFLELFLTAYGSETKSVRVYIDNYNEAKFELLLLLFTLPFVFYVIYFMFNAIYEKFEFKKKEERVEVERG